MMNYLKHTIDSDVVTVTLNREDVHNAFNAELIAEATSLFKELSTKSLRLMVLTGEGKSFCAGADLNWMRSMKSWSEEENFKDSKKLAGLFRTLNEMPFPVIGRVNGHALGGGAGLVACCDYVISSEKALFGFTEARLGLLPAVISPYVMAKIGESQARAWFLSGERFGAEQAQRMNLVHQVVPLEKLDEAIEAVKKSFLAAGPGAAREAKSLIYRVRVSHEVEDMTCKTISRIRIGSEGQEGMRALLEKQAPNWVKP
ncbi:MAG: enoyl-CoA hydratase/isomerase family protein [Bacteriovoracaceae bacterium]|nr:enoyl-CoA hydratase/isomerase family protein [Bacteriovoracaceae bacterium]